MHVHTCTLMLHQWTNVVQHELTMLQRWCTTILQLCYSNVTSIVQWFTMMYDDVMFKCQQCRNDTWWCYEVVQECYNVLQQCYTNVHTKVYR